MDYQKVYTQIIEKAKSENRSKGGAIYYEAHHIVPQCLGGEGKTTQWKWHPNIILLTGREHFLCHWLLMRLYPTDRKLANAFLKMCYSKSQNQQRYVPSSRAYDEAKQATSKLGRSEDTIAKIKKTKKENPRFWTQEEKNAQSLRTLGVTKKSKENYQGPKTENHIENIRRSKLGVPRLKQTCPHCGFIGGAGNMQRWHFNNCKHK